MRLSYLLEKLLVLVGSNQTKLNYAKKAGVKIGSGCTLLGRIEWGSEPYLIEIGDNVRITSGCKFVTHDGGIYVLRNDRQMPQADLFGKIKVGNNVFINNPFNRVTYNLNKLEIVNTNQTFNRK